MLKIVSEFVEQLNRNQIRYVHFKSNEHLNQSVEGSTDFDILVDRESAGDYEKILLNLDFKRFVPQKYGTYPGVDDWIGMDYDTGRFVHLHTHYQLVTGKSGYKNYVLPWKDILLDSAVDSPDYGIKIVSPELETIELFTRAVLKTSQNKLRKYRRKGYAFFGDYRKELIWLQEQIRMEKMPLYLEKCFPNAEGLKPDLFLKTALTAGEFRDWEKKVMERVRCCERSGMQFVNIRSLWGKYSVKIFRKLKKHVFLPGKLMKKTPHTGGLSIAFLGVDGSGKSTVTAEIEKWLSWKFEVSKMSLGIGRQKSTGRYKLKQKVKALLKGSSGKPKVSSKSDDSPKNQSYKTRRRFLKFARAVRKDIVRMKSYTLNGGIMILDRYPQTEYFGIADGPKILDQYEKMSQKERELLGIVKDIQPDVVFKLDVPVEVSKARRPNDDEEILKKKYAILKDVEYPGAKTFTIDAAMPLEEELLTIKRIIWKLL